MGLEVGGMRRRPTGYRGAVGGDRQATGFRYEACGRVAVVEDATMANITDELLARLGASVHGAWELHEATSGQPVF